MGKWILALLYVFVGILWDESGDEYGSAAAGQGATPPAGDPAAEGGDKGQAAQAPEGSAAAQAPETPKYGRFGNTPTIDDVFKAYTELEAQSQNLTGKTTATEKNMAALRKALKDHGVEVLRDEEGRFTLQAINQEPEKPRERRFKDDHKKLFEEPVLQAIQGLVQDLIDDGLYGYEKQQRERISSVRQFNQDRTAAVGEMHKLFPMLKQGAEGFDAAFYTRAEEILNERYCDRNGRPKSPQADLLAAVAAATELGITPTAKIDPVKIEAAKKEGFKQGQESKKVLGPVGSTQAKASGFKKLSKDEYLKLSAEEREKYDKEALQKK